MSANPTAAATESNIDRANSRNAFLAGFSAWTFDAFDFFILTYVLARVAHDFNRPISAIALTLTASLVMRPVGAFFFGLMADRYGRRIPLMCDILFYSVMEIASGLAPTYRTFFILRLLYGIGMGGAWGVGASLALESASAKSRGILSGILQEGYALGNLLAALAFWTVFPRWGWRPMFFIGVIPALLTLLILTRVKESEAWKVAAAKHRAGRLFPRAGRQLEALSLSRGAHGHDEFSLAWHAGSLSHVSPAGPPLQSAVTAIVSVISMLGAITGGALFGLYSDHVGRRKAMVRATIGGLIVIPLWMFSPGVALIALGAFLMQFMVQGAWGVTRAHQRAFAGPHARIFAGVFLSGGRADRRDRAVHRGQPEPPLQLRHGDGHVYGHRHDRGHVRHRARPEAHRVAFGREEVATRLACCN